MSSCRNAVGIREGNLFAWCRYFLHTRAMPGGRLESRKYLTYLVSEFDWNEPAGAFWRKLPNRVSEKLTD